MTRVHGGTDAHGSARFDFSSNSNACAPCAQALVRLQQVEASAYPDASYSLLRTSLAAFHGVATWRVVLACSASEFIFRITAMTAKQNALHGKVHVPIHGYGEYTHAAQAWGLDITPYCEEAHLIWACEPSSPLGSAHTGWPKNLKFSSLAWPQRWVLDCAYEPLRLCGRPSLSAEQRDTFWQLWTPNKALGFVGVRAAYAIAPIDARLDASTLEQLCPSWPIGAHGVALLTAWTEQGVQDWLTKSLTHLTIWKTRQIHALQNLGWNCLPSQCNFFCASPPEHMTIAELLLRLRERGIKLRDAASFGMPKHARISVQEPFAQDALISALKDLT